MAPSGDSGQLVLGTPIAQTSARASAAELPVAGEIAVAPPDAAVASSSASANALPSVERRAHRRLTLLWALVAADAIGLSAAFLTAQFLVPASANAPDRLAPAFEAAVFLLTIPMWLLVAKANGLYEGDERQLGHSTSDEVGPLLQLVTIGTWLVFVVSEVVAIADIRFGKLVLFWVFAMAAVPLARVSVRSMIAGRPSMVQNVLIAGRGGVAEVVEAKLRHHGGCRLRLLGVVDAGIPRPDLPAHAARGWSADDRELAEEKLVARACDSNGNSNGNVGGGHGSERSGEDGTAADLEARSILNGIPDEQIDRVVITSMDAVPKDVVGLIRTLHDRGIHVDVVPRFFELFSPFTGNRVMGGFPLLSLPAIPISGLSLAAKRAFDFGAALLGIVALAPLGLAAALAIKLNSPGPVFFRQVRMGSGGRRFMIFKFRTMRRDAEVEKASLVEQNHYLALEREPEMFKAVDDPRVTRIGRVLRRYSLDELPQLLNVLKGDMSLVGPRPLILEEDCYVEGWGRRRLSLRPGITGVWQVLGRNDIRFAEMVALDHQYVMTWSFQNDLRLLVKTLAVVFKGEKRGF
jgi:exopolysaccharide biosynthesis polyprenyl glycosylphosphotransferase